MAKTQQATNKRSGFWVKRDSYTTFDNSGMYVDLTRFLSTPKGKAEFKSVANSPFHVQTKKAAK